MNNYFLSDNNVNRISSSVSKTLNIKNTQKSTQACRNFVESRMKEVYNKYGTRKPDNMELKDFILKLNQKTIQDCVKLYQQKTNNNKASQISRDKEIYGKRDSLIPARPTHTSFNKNSRELPGMLDDGGMSIMGGSNFSPVLSGKGSFISATGEVTDGIQFNNEQQSDPNMSMFQDKKNSVDDLERRMLELKTNYGMQQMSNPNGNQQRKQPMGNQMMGNNMMNPQMMQPMGNQMMGNNMMNPQMMQPMGNNNMMSQPMAGNKLMYNPNVDGQDYRPPEINFALDGSDSRNSRQKQQLVKEHEMQNPQLNDEHFMGFDSTNNVFDMNMFNFDLMGNNTLGGDAIPPMNQPMNQPMMNNTINQPMMNNTMNQPMMNNDMNNIMFSNEKINENDFQKKLNMMMSDRNNISVQNTGNFNPMMSPSQYNNSNPNKQDFQKGREGGINFNNTKNELISSYGVDLKHIKQMSSKEIDNLISKIKNNIMTNVEEIANKAIDNIDKDDKKRLLNIIKKTKESNNNETVKTKKKKKKVKIVSFEDEIKSDTIKINPKDYTEPEYFNDYLVELSNKYKNVTKIELADYDFPKDLCYINKKNNQLIIYINDDEKQIELEKGNYTIDEIIEGLQEAFDDEKIDLNISLDSDEHIILQSNSRFSFANDSLGRVLGFTKDNYENQKYYQSENKHLLVSKLYIFIENILKDEPIGIIDLTKNKKEPIMKKFTKPISEINEMIIKFKRRPINDDNDDDLVNFQKKPHNITLKLESRN